MSDVGKQRWSRRGLQRKAGGLGIAVSSVFLSACVGRSSSAPTIEMSEKMTFIPDRLTVRVGATVKWRNQSDFVHTATADPGKAHDPSLVELPSGAAPWDSGNFSRGQSWEYRFEVAGTYRYVCLPHEQAGMVGTIIVVG